MPTTTAWVGNAQATAQVVTLTVTAVPGGGGGVLSASINGKTVSYTTLSTDTTSTAAAAWQALLSASTAPPEFQEIAWTVATNAVTATANVPGTPFTGVTGNGLSSSGTGGATLTQATTVANSSPSDVNNPLNWVRSGLASLPLA